MKTSSEARRIERGRLLGAISLLVALPIGTALAACGPGRQTTATLPPPPTVPVGGETTTTVGIGEQFVFAGLQMRITGITDPMTDSESAFVPLPENRFVSVAFEATNPTGAPLTFSPPIDVGLSDTVGGHYSVLLGQRSTDLLGEEVPPGGSISGRFTFELPDSRKPRAIEFRREGVAAVNVMLTPT